MKSKFLFSTVLIASIALATAIGAIATADSPKDSKAADQPEFKLPPGWTEADMQAMMLAGTPGKMHEYLAKGAGEWVGKTTMWMAPGLDPVKSECTSTATPMMDGRYIQAEMKGEIPGMGPYRGFGIYGFDNVSQKFVSSWIDNHSTGMMNGVGELSEDGKKLTWKFTYHCPLTKKPAVMREVETITGPDTKTLEMVGADPKTGKEFKMMHIEFTKKK